MIFEKKKRDTFLVVPNCSKFHFEMLFFGLAPALENVDCYPKMGKSKFCIKNYLSLHLKRNVFLS